MVCWWKGAHQSVKRRARRKNNCATTIPASIRVTRSQTEIRLSFGSEPDTQRGLLMDVNYKIIGGDGHETDRSHSLK